MSSTLNADRVNVKTLSSEVLTTSSTRPTLSLVPTVNDILLALDNRLVHEYEQVVRIRREMEGSAAEYHHYLDLRKEMELRQHDIEKLRGTLGPDYDLPQRDLDEHYDSDAYKRKASAKLRQRLSLWEAIEQIITVTGEIRVSDLQEALETLEIKRVTRQSIESAISTHKDIFRTKKRGREKYVALKSG